MTDDCKEFLSAFEEEDYPQSFLARYEALECLGHSELCETLYLMDRQTGDYAVAKCYRETGASVREDEGDILTRLDHPALPRFLGRYKNETMRCIVREYAQGVPLSELQGRLSTGEVLELMGQLCDALTYLHTAKPPVIHRDIKPQNLILGEDGRLRLIDFGISRSYDGSKTGADTVCLGTKEFSPPEQYGFAQTDPRADIYAAGVLLRWLLTGQTDSNTGRIPAGRLERVAAKCTAFAPGGRYRSAKKLKAALLWCGERGRGIRRYIRFAVILLLVCGCSFWLGRVTAPSARDGQAEVIVFPSRGLEQAVRAELEQPTGAIFYDDLVRVERLALVGEDTFTRDQTYECRAWSYLDGVSRHDYTNGDVTDISLLARMPNLTELYLCDQKISDISPLADLPLTTLALNGNAIEDISVLETMPGLRYLWLGNNPIRNPEPIAAVKWPAYLNLDWVRLESLDFLRDNNVWEFSFMHMAVADGDWSVLAELPSLHAAYTKDLPLAGVEALGRAAQLTRLRLFDCTVPDLTDLSPLAALEDMAVSGLPSLEGVESMTSLRSLGLAGEPLEDLTALTVLPALTDVWADGILADRLDALPGKSFAVRRSD